MLQHITKLQREKIRIWQKKRKFKKWLIFHGFFKNARVIDFDDSPKGENMIFLDQLLKKASVQGPNLTSYKFQTKWRGSDFWLTAQMNPQLGESATARRITYITAHRDVRTQLSYRLYRDTHAMLNIPRKIEGTISRWYQTRNRPTDGWDWIYPRSQENSLTDQKSILGNKSFITFIINYNRLWWGI